MSEIRNKPRLAITMGDVAGIGPELVARVCIDNRVQALAEPVIIGDGNTLRKALRLIDADQDVQELQNLKQYNPPGINCWNASNADLNQVKQAETNAAAGQAAYDWLVAATQAALHGDVDGIVTAPLNKAALHAAGLTYPGHTEILAEQCKVDQHAMMLYLAAETLNQAHSEHGLCVAHVTLHTAIRSVPELITPAAVEEKILLVAAFLRRMGCVTPRIAVCALNPHAGEACLFGDEEPTKIAPGIQSARVKLKAATVDADVSGPLPADAVFRRATSGEFDGIVAMYHDQGHIAFKLLNFEQAVNITLGLPIIRTSPSQGTAYDIAWQGVSRPEGILQAVQVASLLAHQATQHTLREHGTN